MKVLYVYIDGWSNLTAGKWYEVIEEGQYSYRIIDDGDDEWWYRKSYFKTLDQVREEKLIELGL